MKITVNDFRLETVFERFVTALKHLEQHEVMFVADTREDGMIFVDDLGDDKVYTLVQEDGAITYAYEELVGCYEDITSFRIGNIHDLEINLKD